MLKLPEGMALADYIRDLIRRGKLEDFYHTRAWRDIRARVLTEAHYECVMCKERNEYGRATMVHHVNTVLECPELALSEYDEDGNRNLLPLCFACHELIEERAESLAAVQFRLTVVTGMPGAGKTVYVREHARRGSIMFDLDSVARALSCGQSSRAARAIANKLLEPVVQAARVRRVQLYVIRVAPSAWELELFDECGAVYVDLDTDIETCRARRPRVTDDEWTRITERRQRYLTLRQPVSKNVERW